jgi:hypothetical protein
MTAPWSAAVPALGQLQWQAAAAKAAHVAADAAAAVASAASTAAPRAEIGREGLGAFQVDCQWSTSRVQSNDNNQQCN